MGTQVARKEPTGPDLPPAVPSPVASTTGDMPLDPLIAVLSRAADRSNRALLHDHPSKAPG